MDLLLNGKILKLPIVVGITHLEDGDRSARTGDVDSLESRIELDHVRSRSHGQEGNRLALIHVENGHEIVPLARKEGAVMFRVQRHSVVSLTAAARIAADHFAPRR